MNGFIKNFLTLSTVVAIAFGAYSYVSDGPIRLIDETQGALEKKIEDERMRILAYVDSKDAAKSKEIGMVNANVDQTRAILLQQIQKLDDRVYELQRSRSSDDVSDGREKAYFESGSGG